MLKCWNSNFYPRPPRGGRPGEKVVGVGLFGISIHALNAEVLEQQFLSMPSARRATRCPCISPSPTHGFLSTPSARRATMPRGTTPAPPTNFYPRPPRGGRPRCFFVFAQSFVISIHALREEGDAADPLCGLPLLYFYPRPPRGGRPPPLSRATIM